jgi:nicotinamide mononucleotide adenylyltransferase
MTETLDDLLDKLEAIFDCKAGTQTELSKFLNRRFQRVSEWVAQRKFTPPGDVALQMQQWAAQMSNRIAAGGRELQMAYRKSYQEIKERREDKK